MQKNTFTSGSLWPDNNGVHVNAHGGGVLYHEGVYYWFGEHKIEGKAGNRAHVGVHVYSSSDLYNWTDQGIALAVSDDPESPITKGCVMERPKVIYCANTGTNNSFWIMTRGLAKKSACVVIHDSLINFFFQFTTSESFARSIQIPE